MFPEEKLLVSEPGLLCGIVGAWRFHSTWVKRTRWAPHDRIPQHFTPSRLKIDCWYGRRIESLLPPTDSGRIMTKRRASRHLGAERLHSAVRAAMSASFPHFRIRQSEGGFTLRYYSGIYVLLQ